jgi:RNA polymerase sigma-70 factor (ECF subfamily)
MKIRQMRRAEKNARHAAPGASPNGDDLEKTARLAAALAGGDKPAALALVDELHGDGLYRFIHAMVRRDDLADDVYQTTLLEAFRDLGTFGERSSLRTWLYGIARHRCLDALKAGKRRDGRFVAEGELPEPPDDAASALERMGHAELLAALGECMDELAPETRMVLLMRFSEDMPYEDIARVCRASAETMRARVSRALPLLRRCVEQRGAR